MCMSFIQCEFSPVGPGFDSMSPDCISKWNDSNNRYTLSDGVTSFLAVLEMLELFSFSTEMKQMF